ncbi:hypothetical protein [Capnocytophaga sp. oral taxon 338]|uniref:hypothetical protein n=1 Tax=Capnocytophaga sp. oral taxon 338 TaxID=710239 RepID=UPI000202B338|nr:hypothetical protein [Capnocytophaga sp. oral taxon 338]EGD33413.1 hypothetical protein HMPREF9071_1908 [Capnocytophaga sp. oral taxon 338 str. F0234]
MITLQEIEQTYHFKYPTLYYQLWEDGMLDIRWQEGWWKNIFPELKKNPPLLLFRDQFMALDDAEEIVNLIEDYKSQRGIKAEYLLVPFASECAGDVCFFYNREKPEQPPVIVKDWYDFDSAEIIADNLQNFIFYGMLSMVHSIYTKAPICLGDFYENIANLFRTHRPYLTEEQAEVIEKIYSRKLTAYKAIQVKKDNLLTALIHYQDYTALLSDEEFEELMKEYNPILVSEEERHFFLLE